MAILGSYVRFQGCNHWFPLIRPYFFGGSEVLLDSHDKKKHMFLPKPTLEVYSIKISRYFSAKSFGLAPPPKFSTRFLCGVWCNKLGAKLGLLGCPRKLVNG